MSHTRASGRSGSDAPPIPGVLADLLRGVLDPLRDEFSAGEIEDAARVLSRACDQIAAEVLLVDPGA